MVVRSSMSIKKRVLLGAMVLLIAAFFYFDLQQQLSFDGVKQGLGQFTAWKDASPVLVSVLFFCLYVLVTGLSLPGAVVMTLAAGSLFGFLWAAVLVSFASAIGATLAFLVSRYLLRDWVQNKFARRLKAINEGVERDGSFYLFSLRLVPVFPFFLINLLMGLTPIPVRTFYWVSQVGMLAGTLVYINAGTQLAQLDSLGGIVSPSLLLSFCLLGVFPLVAKSILARIKARRVYRGFSKPRHFDRNIIVIGAGAGGLVSAYIAAAVKSTVSLIEAHKMGGDCLNYGCVPSKSLIQSAKLAAQVRDAERYGVGKLKPEIDFAAVMRRVADNIKAIAPHDSPERYRQLGVDVVQGYAKLLDPWRVEISTGGDEAVRQLSARSIVLATGARPVIPDIPGIAAVKPLSSDSLWAHLAELSSPPERVAIIGGGAIACELGQSLARLGSKVSLIVRSERLLKREDQDAVDYVLTALAADGVEVLREHTPLRFDVDAGVKRCWLDHRGQERSIDFDMLLCAVGRQARLSGYGLNELGFDENTDIEVNDYLQTRFPNIFAVGDLVGPYQLTHAAAHQAWYAAVNGLFGQFKKFRVDYRFIPWVTFTDPEIARVGLTEQEAQQQEIPYEVSRYDLADLDRAIVDGEAKGFVKVLTEPGKDRILGVTIVGKNSGELIAEFVLAMKHNLGLNKVLGTIHAYPTWVEANKFAAGEWKKAHAPARVLAWLEKYHAWRR